MEISSVGMVLVTVAAAADWAARQGIGRLSNFILSCCQNVYISGTKTTLFPARAAFIAPRPGSLPGLSLE
jgi:hypothetical protein